MERGSRGRRHNDVTHAEGSEGLQREWEMRERGEREEGAVIGAGGEQWIQDRGDKPGGGAHDR